MKPILSSVILLFLATFINVLAEDNKLKLSEEQIQEMRDAEQKYQDNPYALRVIEQLKKATGITDEEQKASVPAEPTLQANQPEMIQGSRSTADDAYARGDFETAFEQYKALAEAGDSDASLILGTMYEQGQGIDVDEAAAHSWYKKSFEGGDERGEELMKLIEDSSMSGEDMMEADKRYHEISEQTEKSVNGNIHQQTLDPEQIASASKNIQSVTRYSGMEIIDTKTGSNERRRMPSIRGVPYVPVKNTVLNHIKPVTVSSYFQPDRFYRK